MAFFSRAKLLLAVMYRSPDGRGKDEVSLSPIYIGIARRLAVNFTRSTYSYKYTEGISLIYYV